MREPPFWWQQSGRAAATLAPLAAVYGAVAARRMARDGVRARVPVVCIGNPTVGGAGKTPTALAVARMLADAGETPVFLSRGYGGRLAGPLQVHPAMHRAVDIGDEPLLLARAATTVVAHDRVKGAQMAEAAGASVIVMDDGFQNPSLAKDFSVLVVDGGRGIGNGEIIPAGPLRAPLGAQLDRAQALIVVGDGEAGGVADEARKRALPVFRARLTPDASFIASLGGSRVLAFGGIGDPEKFFATLRAAGVAIATARSFPDHHRYTRSEAQALCEAADRDGLVLVTTEKDLARMQGDRDLEQFAARSRPLPVTLMFEDEAGFSRLLRQQIERAHAALKHATL
jgi:tetraacyldisaccharide 4'-kinase